VGIDWFTFFAQVVNFLILIVLLWRFAYRPIAGAMDQRESAIRARLAEAERQRHEADERAQDLDRKHEKFDSQREEMLNRAREEADQRRKDLIAEARERVGQSESEWRDSLERQKQALADELRRCAAEHVVAAARRLVRDMADADLEAQVLDLFEGRLREADDGTLQSLREAVDASDGRLKVVSTFELSEQQRAQLRSRLADVIEREAAPDFETDDALICGIELRSGGHRLAWNAADYLSGLHERIESVISSAAEERQGGTETKDSGATEESGGDESDDDQQR
jgi:F-type H+-transporting ATPase subunit b